MKIVTLTAQNVKRLVAVQINPKGNVVEIRGKNGAGKTSVLDAIWMAMGGKSASPQEPIRQGEKDAVATVHLGSLIVRRTWTAKDSYLMVTTSEGHLYKSPQKVLDELVGKLTFDPLEFSRMNVSDRRVALLGLLGIEESLLDLDRQEHGAYEARRAASKNANEYQAAAKAIVVPGDTPNNPVDIAELSDKLDETFRRQQANDEVRRMLEKTGEHARELQQIIARHSETIRRLQSQIEEARQRHKDALAAHADCVQELTAKEREVKTLVNLPFEPAKLRLVAAQEINANVARLAEKRGYMEKVSKWQAESDKNAAVVDQVRNERKRLLHEAKWPVEGLTVDADTVSFKGVPFDQCSASEQLRVSLHIAMSMNPKLKVLLVRDGSLLDEDTLKLLYSEVENADYQLWIERVGEGDEVGIVIEDGHVRGAEEREPGLPYAGDAEVGEREADGPDWRDTLDEGQPAEPAGGNDAGAEPGK